MVIFFLKSLQKLFNLIVNVIWGSSFLSFNLFVIVLSNKITKNVGFELKVLQFKSQNLPVPMEP